MRGRLRQGAVAAVVAVALVLLLAVAGSAGGAPAAGVTPVASSTCGPVQYEGPGKSQALIVSDLPLQGASRQRSLQMNQAITLTLRTAGWRAGSTKVAFQPCDDTDAATGLWSAPICKANAEAYAADPSVVGVVGTYNSGCAATIIPVLGGAPQGALAMVSPGNTLICLTESTPYCESGEPASLYPHGRNYARVVPNDAYQGAGLASFAKSRHLRRVFILYAGADPTSLGQAQTFRGAARKLHLKIVGFRAWNPAATGYRALMRQVKKRRPKAILLAGLTEENGGQLIKDKVAVLGRNSGRVKLLAPDGFAQQSTITLAGPASKGMFASVPGRVPQNLTGPGQQLVSQLGKEFGGVSGVELYAPYAGQAASVLLQAMGKNGTRAEVLAGIHGLHVTNGITGTFSLLPSGDPSIAPITVSVARSTFVPVRELSPGAALVRAARHG